MPAAYDLFPCESLVIAFLSPSDLLALEKTCQAGRTVCRGALGNVPDAMPGTRLSRTALWADAFHHKLAKTLVEASAYSPIARLLTQSYMGPVSAPLAVPFHRLVGALASSGGPTLEQHHALRLLQIASRHGAAEFFSRQGQSGSPCAVEEGFYRLAQCLGVAVNVDALREAVRFVSYGLQLALLREYFSSRTDGDVSGEGLYGKLMSSSSPAVTSAFKSLSKARLARVKDLLKQLLTEVLPKGDVATAQMSCLREHFQRSVVPTIHGFSTSPGPTTAAGRAKGTNVVIEAFHYDRVMSEVFLRHLVEAHVATRLSFRRMLAVLIAYLAGPRETPGLLSDKWLVFVDIPEAACPLRLQGDRAEYEDIRNSLLDVVLLRGKGLPIALSVLYSAVASGAGLHGLTCAAIPGHVMVRCDENEWQQRRTAATAAGSTGGAAAPPPPPPRASFSSASSSFSSSSPSEPAAIKPLILMDPFRRGHIIERVEGGSILPRDVPLADPFLLWVRGFNNTTTSSRVYSAQGWNPAFVTTSAYVNTFLSAAQAIEADVSDMSTAASVASSTAAAPLTVPQPLREASLHRRYVSLFHQASGRDDVMPIGPASGIGAPVESTIAILEPDVHAVLRVARHHERRAALAAAASVSAGAAGPSAADAPAPASGEGSSSTNPRARRATLFQMPSGSIQQPGRTSVMVGAGGNPVRASAYQPAGVLDKAAQASFRVSQRICGTIASLLKGSEGITFHDEWRRAANLHPFAIEHKRALGALFAYFCFASGLSSPDDVLSTVPMPATPRYISAAIETLLAASHDEGGITALTALFDGGIWRVYPSFPSALDSPLGPEFLPYVRVLAALRRVLDGYCDEAVETTLFPAAIEGRPLRRPRFDSASSSASSTFVEPLGLISAAVAHAIQAYTVPAALRTGSTTGDSGSASAGEDDSEDDADELPPWHSWPGKKDVAPLGSCFVLPRASSIRAMDGAVPPVFAPRTEWRWNMSSPLLPPEDSQPGAAGARSLTAGASLSHVQSQMRPWAIVVDAIGPNSDNEGESKGDDGEAASSSDESADSAAAALARDALKAAREASAASASSRKGASTTSDRAVTVLAEAKGYWRVDQAGISTLLSTTVAEASSASSRHEDDGRCVSAVLLGSCGSLKTSVPSYATLEPCPSAGKALVSESGKEGANRRLEELDRPIVRVLHGLVTPPNGLQRCPCQGDTTIDVDAEGAAVCEGHSILLPYGRSSLIPVRGAERRSHVYFASPAAQAHFVAAVVEPVPGGSSSSGDSNCGRLLGFLPSLETFASAGKGAATLV